MLAVWPATQPDDGPTTVCALTQVVAPPNVGPAIKVQLAPPSTLRYTPAPETPRSSQLRCAGSPIRSKSSPAGRPEIPSPEIRKNEAPPSVLRQTPPPAPPLGSWVATTMMLARASTPVISRPLRAVAPMPAHVEPPSVERRTSEVVLPRLARVGNSR